MEANRFPVRVTPINGGGITIYFPREFTEGASELLPRDNRSGRQIKSYHVAATYNPETKHLTISEL